MNDSIILKWAEHRPIDIRPGKPSMSTYNDNIDAVHNMVSENQYLTVRDIAEEVRTSIGSCYTS